VQQARDPAAEWGMRFESLRFVVRDRDSTYTKSFDAVFEPENIGIVSTAPQSPRMNAHGERAIGTLRHEVLDHVLIWNETHARHVLDVYARHYNGHRPHQARQQRPPLADDQAVRTDGGPCAPSPRTHVLGGLITEHRYAA
jgi:hypothetical protein